MKGHSFRSFSDDIDKFRLFNSNVFSNAHANYKSLFITQTPGQTLFQQALLNIILTINKYSNITLIVIITLNIYEKCLTSMKAVLPPNEHL